MQISERYNVQSFTAENAGIVLEQFHSRVINGNVWHFQSVEWDNGVTTVAARREGSPPLWDAEHVIEFTPDMPYYEHI